MEQGRQSSAVPGYRGIIAWQKAMDLAAEIYRVSQAWPKEEQYGLTNQLRRAAVSIPSNIAEGKGRGGKQEFSRFLSIAYGSLCEAETHLYIAERLSYIDPPTLDRLITQTTEVARVVHGLMRSQQTEVTGPRNDPNA